VVNLNGPYQGEPDTSVQFSSENCYDPDGEIDFYRWNFGDGSSQILDANPTHIYKNEGEYTVTLTVIDDNGTSEYNTAIVIISENYIAPNKDPVVIISGSTTVEEGKPLELDGSLSYDSDGSIESYYWTFGDDTNGQGASVTHTYSKSGSAIVSLLISDDRGATNQTTITVTITPAPFLGIPGFDLFIVLGSICAIIILYKKRKLLQE